MSDTMTKAPSDVLDYDLDFARWLPEGDIITQGTAQLSGSSATIRELVISETIARVWVMGGDNKDTATVTVTITTLGGRVKTTSFKLRIMEVN